MNIENILKRHENLKRQKQTWYPMYRALAHLVMQRKQNFNTDQSEGPFMLNSVFDSTAIHSAHMMASSVLGQIWPNPFESFEFVPQVAQADAAFSDAYDMMNTVNEVLPVNLAIARAGVMNAFWEAVLEACVFGVGAVAVEETGEITCPLVCKSVDAKCLGLAENEQGTVDTVYQEKKFTVGSLVQYYKYENCSEKVQKLYDAAKLDEVVKVLHVIEPRRERNPLLLGTKDMPFASIHIELDTKHLLRESGYAEMPIIVFRFWKNVGEVQGRSPAMDALPDIRALNKLVEMFEKAGEMGLDPPKTIASEDVLGAGKVPWGPGVMIPIHATGRLGSDRRPIEPIVTVANPSWAQQRIADLRENVMQYFMLDKLSDLNNRSRQTLGEANIRNEMRQFMTGPMLIRLLIELVGPFLDRAFNIMLEAGMFGVVEGSVQDFVLQSQGIVPKYLSQDFIEHRMSGLKGYRINFISPAARLMKLEESSGLDSTTQYMFMLAQADASVLHNFNFDEALRAKQRLSGASQKVLYSPAEVEKKRAIAQAQQADAAGMQSDMAQAAAFKDVAKGVKDIGSAASGS